MQRNPYGDADGDVEMSLAGGRSAHDADHAHAFNNVGPSNGSMGGGPVNANSPVPLNTGNSIITIENTPYDIDVLIINQLEEDLDAYRYDLDFCRAQLEPSNANTISPAEQRTWQLRVLDLGHQMRMLNHRIQLMKASMNNARVVGGLAGKVGATTTNAYYGPYPPGTSIQPNAYGTPGGSMVQGYGGAPMGGTQYHPIQPYHPAGGSGYTGYTGYPEPPQERRGPGRPPGSKNRPRASLDPNQPPVLAPSGSAKAAALASAGAKRDLPNEIRVATRKSGGDQDPVSISCLERLFPIFVRLVHFTHVVSREALGHMGLCPLCYHSSSNSLSNSHASLSHLLTGLSASSQRQWSFEFSHCCCGYF